MKKLCLGVLLCAFSSAAARGTQTREPRMLRPTGRPSPRPKPSRCWTLQAKRSTPSLPRKTSRHSWKTWSWRIGPTRRFPRRYSHWDPLCSSRRIPSSWARPSPTVGPNSAGSPLLGTLPDLRDLGPLPAVYGGSRDGRASGQLFLKGPKHFAAKAGKAQMGARYMALA